MFSESAHFIALDKLRSASNTAKLLKVLGSLHRFGKPSALYWEPGSASASGTTLNPMSKSKGPTRSWSRPSAQSQRETLLPGLCNFLVYSTLLISLPCLQLVATFWSLPRLPTTRSRNPRLISPFHPSNTTYISVGAYRPRFRRCYSISTNNLVKILLLLLCVSPFTGFWALLTKPVFLHQQTDSQWDENLPYLAMVWKYKN